MALAFNDIGAEVSDTLADAATTCAAQGSANGTLNALYGVLAPDRETLIETVQKLDGSRLMWPSGPYLRIVLPCGNVREWLSDKDIPAKSIQCHCEDLPHIKEHWFIKYGDKR